MKKNPIWFGKRVRCDTETARKIGSWSENSRTETLYRTKAGIFFLHRIGSGIWKVGPYGRPKQLTPEEEKIGTLTVISVPEAKEWCETHLDKDDYSYLFFNFPDTKDEAAWEKDGLWMADRNPLKTNIRCTIAVGVAKLLEEQAKKEEVSQSEIVEKAVLEYVRNRL